MKKTELRKRAEEKLRERLSGEHANMERTASFSESRQDTDRLIHDLEVHQIELEMQNEELVQSRTQVQELLNRYTELYDFAPVGYFTLKRDGTIVQANITVENMLGAKHNTLINQHFKEFVSVESRLVFDTFLENVFRSKKKEVCEASLTTKKSIPIYVQFAGTISQNGEQYFINVLDITELRYAYDALRESEMDYETLANSGITLVWASGTDKLCNYFNKVWLEFTGRTQEQEMGNGWAEGVHPDDLQRCLEIYIGAFDQREKFSMDYRLRRHDGEYRWLQDVGVPKYNITGLFIGYIGHCYDITERKRAEDNIRESEEKYRLLYESNQMAIAIYDSETLKFLSANTAFVHRYGYTKEELLTMTILEIRPETEIEKVKQSAKKIDKGLVNLGEYLHKTKNGELLYVEIIRHDIVYEGKKAKLVFANDITERRRAEEAERASNEKYRTLVTNSPYCIHEINCAGQLISMNKAGLKMMVVENENEILGNLYLNTVSDDDRDRIAELMKQAIEGRSSEFTFKAINGHEFQSSFVPIVDKQGNVIRLMGQTQDITDRKRAEEELFESEEKYRGLVENSANAIAIYVDGKIVFVNNECVRLMGSKNKEELIGKSVIQFVHPDNRAMVIERMKQVAIEGKPLPTAEEKFIRLDGTSVDVEVKAVPMIYEKRPAVQLIVQDITERKHAEIAIRESEEKHRSILQTAMDGFWLLDLNGNILEVNDAYCRMSGYNRQELLVMKISDLEIIETTDITSSHIQIVIDAGEDRFESKHRRKDGNVFDVEISVQYRQIEGGRLVVFLQNISERKNSEQAIRNAQKLESIGTLAGGIAHDFNNLMNAVLGQSSLALHKLPKESPAASHIAKAIKASERVADLTKQLLAYSGKGKFIIDEIDLNTLVKENVQMLEVSIPKTTKLRYELGSPSPHIKGDISQIQQVIMNLIINSGEAMDPNPGTIIVHTGRIEISKETNEYSKYTNVPLAAGLYAILKVKDSGSGISEETLSRIFDPFFTTKFTGRGLGLAAVLGIIKGHKGGLRIESEVGKGTLFEIIIPLVASSKTTDVSEKEKLSVVNGEGKTILVIDDEASVIELLEDVLPGFNFKVISALDPLKGIEIYRREHKNISMVVLDYSMPNMDGKAAIEELLKINKDVKVLLCSGYSEEETLSVFGQDRPTGYFQKPYKPEALLQRVAEIILQVS